MAEYFIGLMSGTSMDAVDAVLVDFADHPPRLVHSYSQPLSDALRTELLAVTENTGGDLLDRAGRLDTELGELFARCAGALLEQANLLPEHVRALGSHGQTLRHCPAERTPFTWQAGDPNVIAERAGLTVVADFRRRDVAAGGQGAPLVPAFHAAVLSREGERRCVLNLGGMANITLLPGRTDEPVFGFDTGPGNVLLDTWCRENRGQPRDDGGAWAASGRVDGALLERLLQDPYFQQPPPKSTGRERFNARWLRRQLHEPAGEPADIQATLTELTAVSVARAVATHAGGSQRLLVCGGGVHNTHLFERLQAHLPGIPVESTAGYGLAPDWVEAMAFAWLARERLAGRPANLPSVTGARRPVVLGGVFSGPSLPPV